MDRKEHELIDIFSSKKETEYNRQCFDILIFKTNVNNNNINFKIYKHAENAKEVYLGLGLYCEIVDDKCIVKEVKNTGSLSDTGEKANDITTSISDILLAILIKQLIYKLKNDSFYKNVKQIIIQKSNIESYELIENNNVLKVLEYFQNDKLPLVILN